MTATAAAAILGSIQIASPCQADWDEMEPVLDREEAAGAVRFCGMCRKHVYDLSAMSADEAVATIQRQEGTLCVRLFRRSDGTVIHRDCPRGVMRGAKRIARAGFLLLFVAGVSLASWLLPHFVLRESPMRGQMRDGWQTLVSELRTMIGISRPSPPVMGGCAPPPPIVPAAPAAGTGGA